MTRSAASPMRTLSLAVVLAGAVALAGCGSSSAGSSAAAKRSTPPAAGAGTTTPAAGAGTKTHTTGSGVNPNQRETLPPGDIPDTVAYVPYTSPSLHLTVSTPEGWSRSTTAGALVFTDKLNRIEVFAHGTSATATPSIATARSSELPAIMASVKGFSLQSVTTVKRPSGTAVRIAYLGDSTPDPVTGKVGTLAFERYDFFDHNREVVLLLSSPKGSDNVDPWFKVTSSLKLTR